MHVKFPTSHSVLCCLGSFPLPSISILSAPCEPARLLRALHPHCCLTSHHLLFTHILLSPPCPAAIPAHTLPTQTLLYCPPPRPAHPVATCPCPLQPRADRSPPVCLNHCTDSSTLSDTVSAVPCQEGTSSFDPF